MFAVATEGTAEPMAIDRDVDVMLDTTSTCRVCGCVGVWASSSSSSSSPSS
jgi:hypothetical protein